MVIRPIQKSKIQSVDFDNLSFGTIFSDHMFVCDYADGAWSEPEIIPYAPIQLDPSASALHYGQAIFEGMKAYKDDHGDVWLFRPDQNIKRLNKSAERLAIPQFPEGLFLKGLHKLIDLDRDWVQSGVGNSLYIRPFMFASGKKKPNSLKRCLAKQPYCVLDWCYQIKAALLFRCHYRHDGD